MNTTIFFQSLIDGILQGGIYACCAVGLSLSFGVMRIFNWAQGDCVMMALYMAVFLIGATGMHPLLAALLLGPVMFLLGFLLQKYLLNPLVLRAQEREPLSVLLTTAGLSYVLANAATYFFTSNSRSVRTALTGQVIKFAGTYIATAKLVAFLIVILITVALELFLSKTEWGRALRATSQDRETAQLMGMNNKLLYCLALGIGFACIGVAGAMLSSFTPVSPATGNTYGFKCLVIVVLGGKGSVPGALVGGLLVGLIESFGGVIFSSLYAQIILFGIFALTLFFKPNGLLAKT